MDLREGEKLVRLARKAIECHFKGEELKVKGGEPMGVFVTLLKHGELRGCIGFPQPILPLYEGVVEAAKAAAFKDPRFLPLEKEELDEITIEVSVLTKPEPIKPEEVKVGKHGLIVKKGFFSGLLLPQVPLEWGWDREEFLSQTCVKAGLSPLAWRGEDVELYAFTAEIFKEVSPGGKVIKLELEPKEPKKQD